MMKTAYLNGPRAGVWALLGVLFLTFVAGCGTAARSPIRGEAQARAYDGDLDLVFDAAKLAVRERGFRVVEQKQAAREMRALSPIHREAGMRGASQREIVLSVRESGMGQAEVTLRILLIEENQFGFESPLATRVFLPRSPLYPLIFGDIQREFDNLLASPENL